MLKNYFLTTLRNMLRQKIYTVINITGLAIGLAACMILFIWIHNHLSFDRFHDKSDRIARMIMNIHIKGLDTELNAGTTAAMAPMFAAELPEIEKYVRIFRLHNTAMVRNGDVVQPYWEYYYADPSFFDIFSYEMLYGDPQTALVAPKSLVLTYEAANALFGKENPVGRFVQVSNESNYKITGVLKKLPVNTHLHFQVLASFDPAMLQDYIDNHPYDSQFISYALLKPGVDWKVLETKFPPLLRKIDPIVGDAVDIILQPLEKIHLYSNGIEADRNWRKTDISIIYIFAAIAIMILMIACMNYINLATARARRRSREVGIRKAVGASKFELVWQFLGESVFLAFIAMFLGYLIIRLAMPLLDQLFDNELVIVPINHWQVFGWMSMLALVVGLVTGLYPAIILSTPTPKIALSLNKQTGESHFNLRRVLVVAQFVITMVLIISSFTITKQLRWIQNKDLGFNKEHVISFKMPPGVQENYEVIRQRLLQNTWISGVTGLGPNNMGGFWGKQFHYEGQPQEDPWFISCSAVDYDFMDFYGLHIVEGRNFSRDFETDKTDAYIINETLKRKLGWDTAVGKEFQIMEMKDRPGRVIGVVKDFNLESLHSNIEGLAFCIQPQILSYISVRCAPANVSQLFDTMHQIWAQYAPNAGFERFFLDDVYNQYYFSEQRAQHLMTVFSILAIFIACIGLLGLVSYSTEQRTKEIGVRKVLGATIGNIFVALLREFFIMLNIAVLIAWPMAWMISSKWLETFAYRTKIGISIYILAWMVTLLIAFLTIAGQVLKATLANPIKALRYE